MLRLRQRSVAAFFQSTGWDLYRARNRQVLISQVDIKGSAAFNIIVAIFAMAVALVSLTRAEPPQITAGSAPSLWPTRADSSRRRCRSRG